MFGFHVNFQGIHVLEPVGQLMHPFNANGQKRGPSLERRIFLPRMVTLPTSKKTHYDGGYSVGLENPPSER